MMSWWMQIVHNPAIQQKLIDFYGPHFPIEVRHILNHWFEGKDWDAIDVDNPLHEPNAQLLLNEFLIQLRNKSESTQDVDYGFFVHLRIEQTFKHFQSTYKHNALAFVRFIKHCMEKEKQMLMLSVQAPNQPEANEALTQENTIVKQISADLNELNQKILRTNHKLNEMKTFQESFLLFHRANENFNEQILQQQKQLQDPEQRAKLQKQKEQAATVLSQKSQQLFHLRNEIGELFHNAIVHLQKSLKQVLDELNSWKRCQQLAGNGMAMDSSSLDGIQQWCEHLAELIWNVRHQIKKVGILRAEYPIDLPTVQRDNFSQMYDLITGLLNSLVHSTFIVENQPPQVLKKESRFSASVRLLVGGKLDLHLNLPQVKATIISEFQAKKLLQGDTTGKEESSGDILNHTGTMEYHETTGQLKTNFKAMQLKKITRSDRRGSEAVTEEKFCILFRSDFNVGGNFLQVRTLSLPVVVTVHGNQDCNALATVLWDNAFSDLDREPFVVPDSVPWVQLAEQLNLKFLAATGRGLTEENLHFLASKIYGQKQDYSQSFISWTQFNKDTLPDRPFTFWEWFHSVLKLTKEHLKKPWCDGSIIGFISKVQAQERLNQQLNGTFLLRFSDSECGGITIAWIAQSNSRPEEREVWNLAPFTAKDFPIRSLADRIKDLKQLVYLYPQIPKDDAFSQYYQMPQDLQSSSNGYIPSQLVVTVVNHRAAVMMYDAQSPLYSHQNSLSPAPPPLTPQSQPVYNNDDLMEVPEIDSIVMYLANHLAEEDVSDINQQNAGASQFDNLYHQPFQ